MSDDDHHDDHSSGGLWDPDTFSAPLPPRRPALRAVPPPASATAEHGPSRLEHDPRPEEALVRLEQFRPATEGDARLDQRHPRFRPRHGLRVAAALLAAAALGAGALNLNAGRDPATRPTESTFTGADAEQAALTRSVKPAGTGHHDSSAGRRHTANPSAHPAPTSHHRQAATTRAETSAHQPRQETVSRRLPAAAPSSRGPASSSVRASAASSVAPASATNSEFGFEH